MVRARRPLHVATILGAAILVASGCGGGGAETTTAPADGTVPASPTPGAGDVPGGTASETPQLDPATGLPVDPAAAGGAAPSTASVPDLVGDDVAGGLGGVGDATPLFDAQAVSGDNLPDEKKDESGDAQRPTLGGGTTTTTPTTKAVTYSGAKIFVDGIVHTVNKNGTFPKGNPVFRLLSVSAGDIEIALVAGEFTSSGGDGTFLDKGDLVSMVNASEQVTYRLKYLRPVESSSDIAF